MMRHHDTARMKSTTREHESSWTLTQTACSTRFIVDERVVTSEKFSEKNVPSWLSEYGELRAHGLQTNLILNNFKQFQTISNNFEHINHFRMGFHSSDFLSSTTNVGFIDSLSSW